MTPLVLEGIHLPVTTPFDPSTGRVDGDAFLDNLHAWLSHPIAGLVVGGSTGEAPLLDSDELLRLVALAREAAGARTVTAGTGAESTRETIRLSRAAAERGADAVLVRPPAYYRDAMTPEALRRHYEAVADASPVPVILYHIPRFVPVELVPDLVGALAAHGNVAGIKDSSGDVRNLGALAAACEGRATVLVGAGTLLYAALELGAAGGVIAVGLLAPAEACALHEAWRRGDGAGAGRLQERIGPVHRAVVAGLGVPGIKAALELLGLHGGPPRPPLLPVSEAGRRRAAAALADAGLRERSVRVARPADARERG